MVPRPENARRQRRRWSATEKKRILDEAAACEARGELGELLRKEGSYSSHLHNWRRDFEQEGLVGLEPKPTGRKPLQIDSEREITKLMRKNSQLVAQISLAQKVIGLQKKRTRFSG